jgi:hemerythrin-like domain-containing protein
MNDAIEQLMAEHRLIEEVLGSLAAFAESLDPDHENARPTLSAFAEFFREFADHCHHGKEEDRLFQAMARHGFDPSMGPVAVMLHEHEVGRQHVRRLAEIGGRNGPLTTSEADRVRAHAREFVPLLAGHIQKEDRLLYPMAVQAVPASEMEGLAAEFETFERTAIGEENHARLHQLANRLIQEFPPEQTAPSPLSGCPSAIQSP